MLDQKEIEDGVVTEQPKKKKQNDQEQENNEGKSLCCNFLKKKKNTEEENNVITKQPGANVSLLNNVNNVPSAPNMPDDDEIYKKTTEPLSTGQKSFLTKSTEYLNSTVNGVFICFGLNCFSFKRESETTIRKQGPNNPNIFYTGVQPIGFERVGK